MSMEKFDRKKIESPTDEFNLLLENLKNGKIPHTLVLFGAGSWGKYYLTSIEKIFEKVIFCDNNPRLQGELYESVPVISFTELKENYKDSYITITSFDYYEEILEQLLQNGMAHQLLSPLNGYLAGDFAAYHTMISNNEMIFNEAFDALTDLESKEIFYDRINYCVTGKREFLIPKRSKCAQYFESGIVSLSSNEIFIDGGAYIGDTVEEFLSQTSSNFEKIISFEPEESKIKVFEEKFKSFSKIQLIKKGLWSESTTLQFSPGQDGASSISNEGSHKIAVTSIDDTLQGSPVSYIKLDIEGAELEALKGAAESIKKHKPRLAVCVYHKPMDLVDIPVFLKRLVPEYNIYLRHYNIDMFETVCYATLDNEGS